MSEFILDGQRFDTESLSELDNSLKVAFQYTNQEVARLKRRLAIAQTARNAYAVELSKLLPEETASSPRKDEKFAQINGRAYPLASLSGEALQNIQALKECDRHLQRLDVDLASAETALMGYGQAFKSALTEGK